MRGNARLPSFEQCSIQETVRSIRPTLRRSCIGRRAAADGEQPPVITDGLRACQMDALAPFVDERVSVSNPRRDLGIQCLPGRQQAFRGDLAGKLLAPFPTEEERDPLGVGSTGVG